MYVCVLRVSVCMRASGSGVGKRSSTYSCSRVIDGLNAIADSRRAVNMQLDMVATHRIIRRPR